jgi:hypothetical protein
VAEPKATYPNASEKLSTISIKLLLYFQSNSIPAVSCECLFSQLAFSSPACRPTASLVDKHIGGEDLMANTHNQK